jgi:oxalate decarboxylase/phosphoglucose isomerase-like protein (cupin superfamily)
MNTSQRYAVNASEQPVIDQSEPGSTPGGNARDQGSYVELISRRLTNADTMMMGLAWLEPGQVHLLHNHPNANEWYYVMEGSARFTIGDETITGVPGTAMYIPAGVSHKIVNDGQDTLQIAWGVDVAGMHDAQTVWEE